MSSLLQSNVVRYYLRNFLLLAVGLVLARFVFRNILNFNIEYLILASPWGTLILGVLIAYLGLRFVRAVERIADAVEQVIEEESGG